LALWKKYFPVNGREFCFIAESISDVLFSQVFDRAKGMTMEYVFYGTQLVLTLFTFYYFVVSLFGFWRRPEDYSLPPSSRFAVVTAAHNEEKVIGQLIRNLHELNYPKELFDIYVIADNCSDNTATIAASAGANVIKRFNDEEKGKGYALEYAFNQIFKSGPKYDAVEDHAIIISYD